MATYNGGLSEGNQRSTVSGALVAILLTLAGLIIVVLLQVTLWFSGYFRMFDDAYDLPRFTTMRRVWPVAPCEVAAVAAIVGCGALPLSWWTVVVLTVSAAILFGSIYDRLRHGRPGHRRH